MASSNSVPSNKNILVLDDNKFILEALSGTLKRYLKDCTVMTASTSVKGTEILRSTPIDLILTDLDLRPDDGYQFIENARSSYPGIPLCVMSGTCEPHVKERLQRLGISRYIEKPFPVESLATMISEELKGPAKEERTV